MDFELSEELIAVRDLAREFAEKEIAPTAAQDDKEHKFRKDLLLKMGELGFFGSVIPEKYGGNGLGFLAMVLITEEVARVHSAVRVAINMQIGPALALLQFGNEEQKKKWIPPLLRGEFVGCFAITEPDAGSDVSAIRTTAARKERRLRDQWDQTLDLQCAGGRRRLGLCLYGQESKAPRAIGLLRYLRSARSDSPRTGNLGRSRFAPSES